MRIFITEWRIGSWRCIWKHMLTLLLRSKPFGLVTLCSTESYYTAQRVKWIALGRTRFGLNNSTSAFSSPRSSAISNSLHNSSAPVFSVWFSSSSTSKTFPPILSHRCARGVAQHNIKAIIFWRMRSGLPNFVMYSIWKLYRQLPINFT